MGLKDNLFTLKLGTFYVLQKLFGKKRPPVFRKRLGTCREYSLSPSGDCVLFQGENGTLSVSVRTPKIFNVLVTRKNDPDYFSSSVLDNPVLKPIVSRDGDVVVIKAEEEDNRLEARVNLNNLTIAFYLGERMLHNERVSAGSGAGWVSVEKIPAEKEDYVGFGQKTGPLVKNGRRLVMWNNDDPNLSKNSDPIYQSCPFQIAIRTADGSSHGIFYDNTHYSIFDIGGKKRPATTVYSERGPLSYYVLAGPGIKDVTEQFSYLTGRYELPPSWVLGHHHSRWEENESEERILKLANEFRNRHIPCDTLHLDIGHMEGCRCFTWNKKTFPNAKDFIEKLHKQKFRVAIITDPGLKYDPEWEIYKQGAEKGYFCKDKNGKIFHAPVWPGPSAFPDFTSPEVCDWWGTLYKNYTDIEVDGFWIDMNEPSLFTLKRTIPVAIGHRGGGDLPAMDHRRAHNIYGFLMARASASGLKRLRPNERYFLFTRSSFAGIQRYASSWTGDNRSSWLHFKLSIPMILNMGLSGQPMTGPDTGGFWDDGNGELLARWMAVSAFYPFSRNHTSNGTIQQEVWCFGDEVEKICKKYLELRYSLLPYLYSGIHESTVTGAPLMRPLFYEFPEDEKTRDPRFSETEFLCGSSFLIAPVFEPGATKRNIYLPGKSAWYHYFTGEKFEAGKEHEIPAPLDMLPIFVRTGSAIPFVEPSETTTDAFEKDLIVRVYPGKPINGTIYIDDGSSLNYKNDEYSLFRINGDTYDEGLSFSIRRIKGSLASPFHRHTKINISINKNGIENKVTNISINDKSIGFAIETNDTGSEWIVIESLRAALPLEVRVYTQKGF
jgi:alpha-glucosidase